MTGISGLGQSQLYNGQQIDRAADKLMSRKDADGNGTLSAEELGGPEGSFAKVDTNADGQVDKSELVANKPRPLFNHIAAQAIRKMDSDGNGTLSAEELGMSTEPFDKIDKNQDGEIDKKELGGLLMHRDAKVELPNPTKLEQVVPPQSSINIYTNTNIFLDSTDSEGDSGQTDQQV
ncbi:MAG: EF-hand domain-containing protein [Phycisphaerae bacterium]|nr:EF-hand domain-containing protein [Phycisphaerae bacterium]